MEPTLALKWDNTGRRHEDLTLELGDYRHPCDTHLLARDPQVRAGETGDAKVEEVLRTLLRGWLRTLEALADGGVAYLPFDLSEVATGWLRASRQGDALVLEPGWSAIAGGAVSALDVGRVVPRDFAPVAAAPALTLPREACLTAVQASLDALSRRPGR